MEQSPTFFGGPASFWLCPPTVASSSSAWMQGWFSLPKTQLPLYPPAACPVVLQWGLGMVFGPSHAHNALIILRHSSCHKIGHICAILQPIFNPLPAISSQMPGKDRCGRKHVGKYVGRKTVSLEEKPGSGISRGTRKLHVVACDGPPHFNPTL